MSDTPNPPSIRGVGGIYQKAVPGNDYIETTSGLNLQMVWVDGGTFKMGGKGYGDEKPVHEVTLDGFWLSKYQVTQAQYEAIMGKNPARFKGPNKPVECVSWNDAKEYCRRLSEETGGRFVLPSETQWEFACRGGSELEYCFGDKEEELEDYAWYGNNSNDETHSVGLRKPNAWGLYDMHGNVWEWCEDDWHDNYEKAPGDGKPWVDEPRGNRRVLRGGSWYYFSFFCRSAYRFNNAPDITNFNFGFRLARTP